MSEKSHQHFWTIGGPKLLYYNTFLQQNSFIIIMYQIIDGFVFSAFQVLYFLPRILVMPFVCLVYYLWPFSKHFEYWKAPMYKFLADTVSYLIFLTLLFLSLDPSK